MSLQKRSIIGFTALNVLMIVILIIDLANLTSLDWLSTVLTILGITMTLSYIFYVKYKIIKPITQLAASAQAIAEGNLHSAPIEANSNDEISELAKAFVEMKEQLHTMTQKIASSSAGLTASIEELSASTNEITTAVEEVDSQMEKTTEGLKRAAQSANESAISMQETADGIERITVATQDVFDHAKEANGIAGNGAEILYVAKNQMQFISNSTEKTSELMQQLSSKMSEIKSMTDMITGITEQTNLLALNAAIEAARAGEHGKGFAVVAEEVRKLAEQSKDSAVQIVDLVVGIESDTKQVATSVEEDLKNVQQGAYIIDEATKSFGTISSHVSKMTSQLEDISATAEELTGSANDVTKLVSTIATEMDSLSNYSIRQTRPNLYDVNMGATAVGTGLNAFPDYIKSVDEHLAEISGLPLKGATHLVDATQNTDAYTEVSGALKICMINMSKIANDLRLMASGPRAGLGEIILPARQPGSSIMPGKVNPVMPEVLNQVAFQVIGNDHTISLASEAGQLELNVMEPVLVFNLIQSISIMNNVFRAFTENCLKDIEANEDRMKEYVEKSVGVLTAVNPHIGYEVAARLAREAILTGRSIRELCLEAGILTKEQLDLILDPYEMTHPGIAGSSIIKLK